MNRLTTAVELFPLKNYLSSPFNESSNAPEPIGDHSVFSEKSKWQGSNEVRQKDNADPLIFMCNEGGGGGGGGVGVSLLEESLSYVKILAFWVG